MDQSRQAGFTLIELSIVLVIIGLVVGGVLVGQDLIKAAQARKIVTEIGTIETAVQTFESKYNCIPGDCATATQLFSGAVNGDGNGLLDTIPSPYLYAEIFQFWYQLSAAGLIAGSYTGVTGPAGDGRNTIPGTNVMASTIGPGVGYTAINWAGYDAGGPFDFSPPVMSRATSNVIVFGTENNGIYETDWPAITPGMQFSVDTKIDDGMPGEGNLVVPLVRYPYAYGLNIHCINGTNFNPATASYDLTNTKPDCAFMVINPGF